MICPGAKLEHTFLLVKWIVSNIRFAGTFNFLDVLKNQQACVV